MNQIEQSKTTTLLNLIDLNSTNPEKTNFLIIIGDAFTLEDLNLHLKKQIGIEYDFKFEFNNKEYIGPYNVKVRNLIEKKTKLEIHFRKKEIVNQESARETGVGKQNYSQSLNQSQYHQQEDSFQQNSKIGYEIHNIQNQQTQKQLNNIQQEQQPTIINFESSYIQSNQIQIDKKQLIFESQSSNQVQKICEQVLSQWMDRIERLEEQVNNIKTQEGSIIQQIQNLLQTVNIQQKEIKECDLIQTNKQKVNQFQEQINEMKSKIFSGSENFNEFKGKIEKYLQVLNQEIININHLSQKQNFNSNSLNQSYLFNSSISNFSNSQLLTQITIQLSCQHQIEKQQLEQILSDAISEKTQVCCQICQFKISSQIIRQLGHLGDQYLLIQNDYQINKLYEKLEKAQILNRYPHLARCNAKGCNFFCFFNAHHIRNQQYFCPACLAYTVYDTLVQSQHNFKEQSYYKN